MTWVALVGPESEENLSLRYLAGSLARSGYSSDIVPFEGPCEFESALASILDAPERPALVKLSLNCELRAQVALSLALALRQRGYAGHISAGGRIATAMCVELLRDFAELDSVVRQEGEHTVVALVSALEGGSPLQGIAGLAFRNRGAVVLTESPALPDFATLPWPDRRGAPARCFDHAIAPLLSGRAPSRLRDPDDVAAEMVALQRKRGVEIFDFRDDEFFRSGKRKNLERLHALADALELRGIRRFASVVRARAADVDRELFQVLRDRLQAIRVDLKVDDDAEPLRRWQRQRRKQRATEIVRELDLYSCLNILAFAPDTTLESLATNLDFAREACDFPFDLGRVELRAGSPLLAHMQAEGRVRGDYLHWDYSLRDPKIERVSQLTRAAFRERARLVRRVTAARFELEVCRHFHPARHERSWRAEGIALTRALGEDSVHALRCIVQHVDRDAPSSEDARFVAALARGMRAAEAEVGAALAKLATRIGGVAGRGRAPVFTGDRVAVPGPRPELVSQ
jgi:anaerobic magnesium-protoporphyrin IX monomethyl ester cyclase